MQTNIPLCSVLMITYNHEKYIAAAIEGVIKQQTDFDYQLIIGDDFSTDGTREICLAYESKFPDKINLLLHNKNLGGEGKNNFLSAYAACKGKYLAMCDGDDYWIDENKLQKQIDFLEANEDYALCFHQTKTLYEDGTELWYNDFKENISFDFIDLVQRPFISTVSSVFKNPKSLPDWYNEVPGDWSIFLYMASLGKIYYMSECMAVYRRHSGGIFSSLSNDEKYNNTINLLDKLDKIFNYEYHEYFEKSKQARHAIHYPPVIAPVKRSLLSRIEGKVKSILLRTY